MSQREPLRSEFLVDEHQAGRRLDQSIASRYELSRTRVQELIDAGLVLVNLRPAKGSHRVRHGERVSVEIQQRPPLSAQPESIPLDIVYEDEDVIAVNKPAGMTVHAGAGNPRPERGEFLGNSTGSGAAIALDRGNRIYFRQRPPGHK